MIHMTVFLSDLQAGRSSSTVQDRLLRYWEARNFRRGGELMGVDMLLLDSQTTMMQASVNSHRIPKFQETLTAGKMFTLSSFDVVSCTRNLKITESPFIIRLNDYTEFIEMTTPSYPLPLEAFRFLSGTEFLRLANTNSQLTGIVLGLVIFYIIHY
ncbi:unnamed protein product [Eruca vesicaria subsp. sativa]|uniref:Replication protein A 70 kDa DNA-binding subunit B/D first OB fold domain-containing protein n=1 Tax=Eruca vesicaria subsp. sativa TaxID=29727 RepID=A0ABC8IZN7_ERUVS|nr:unnamed protein product [Eruca vesicaria subsp. sativa]